MVAKEGSGALVLSSVDARAARLGLTPGLALTDARARHPALDVVPADAGADAKLLCAIADDCERYTPLVGLDGADGLMLDISGAAHLFGGERAMLDRIVRRLRNQGFSVVHAAIAGTAAASRALCRFAPMTIVGEGGEAEAVMPLPVEALLTDGATLHGLKRAGLKTIGAVASRDRKELAARFGVSLIARLDEALGRAGSPISPLRPVPDYAVERNFADPVSNPDFIVPVLEGLADALGAMLERDGEGARAVEASFFRADGAVRRIAVAMGRPERAPQILMRLLKTKLDAVADPLDPGFGFDLIRLTATGWGRREPRALRFGGQGTAPDDLAALVDRLAARLGSRRVLRVRLNDTHIPERAATFEQAREFRATMQESLALQKRKLVKRRRKKSHVFTLSPPSCPVSVPGIHGFVSAREDVDGRDKPGHDETKIIAFPSNEEAKRQEHKPAKVSSDSSARPDVIIPFRAPVLRDFADLAKPRKQPASSQPPHRPVRLFADPERIDDVWAVIPDGPPARFRWRSRTHSVARAEGPERIAMEWWRIGGAHLTRDYFRVEDDAGLRLWLYRDGLYGQEAQRPSWFVHGLMG